MAARLRSARGRADQSRATTTRFARSVTTLRPGNRRLRMSPDPRSGAARGQPCTSRPVPRSLIRPGGAAVDHFGFDHLAKALGSSATRRASLGFFAAGLLGLTSVTEDGMASKRKKRRRRCKKKGTSCASGKSCCSGTCDFLVKGGTCAPCKGRSCDATRSCCGGQDCTNGYCGGCRDRAVSCTADTDCCFSNCTSGACLSAQGGQCARDVDCRACYLGQNCDGACVNGSCTI
jgi:hypothetical protein